MSLDWLEHHVAKMQSAGSLALAKICLETFGRRLPANRPVMADLYEKNEFLESVQVAAWTYLAGGSRSQWLALGKTT
jgi:hypothetical protein